MTEIRHQIVDRARAEHDGFATYDPGPHLCIDLPDLPDEEGKLTVSIRTSEGKRLTLSLLPYRHGGPAQCADVVYHDAGLTQKNGDKTLPAFDALAFKVGSVFWDTRVCAPEHKPVAVTVLMDKPKGGA